MFKLRRQVFVVLTVLALTGCNWFQPTAYFVISNTSMDNKPVDIKVTVAGKTIFEDTIRHVSIRPDLTYTPHLSLPKGKYTIAVYADSGRAIAEQSINLNGDRWIFISYLIAKPIDSAQARLLLTNFGNDTSWVNRKLRGLPSKVIVYIMDKEPMHM